MAPQTRPLIDQLAGRPHAQVRAQKTQCDRLESQDRGGLIPIPSEN